MAYQASVLNKLLTDSLRILNPTATVEKGLGSGVSLGSEAAKMWMSYLVFLRRKIKWDDENHQESVLRFREACHTAISYLDQC